jgi:hypothetical protein
MVEFYDDRCISVFPNQGITHKEHQGFLQFAFLEVASALGVPVEQGQNFKETADKCAVRARAGATGRAHQYEAVLALLGTSADVLGFAEELPKLPAQARKDIELARTTFNRALSLLRELAGKK